MIPRNLWLASNTYSLYIRILFRGTVSKHPHDHIEYLEDMMDDKYNRCKLFSFSLEGDARKWLDQLPAGSLTCWKEIKNSFINHFFDGTHYWDVRKKISTFRQNPRESFRNAWERFKSCQLQCPHHGYSEPHLINKFRASSHEKRPKNLRRVSPGTRSSNIYPSVESLKLESDKLELEWI